MDDLKQFLNDITEEVSISDIITITYDNNINIILEKKTEIINLIHVCERCLAECHIINDIIHCNKCGFDSPIYIDGISYVNDNNVNQNSSMSFNVTGKNSYKLQQSLFKTCASYVPSRRNKDNKEMHRFNTIYEGNKLPKQVVNDAIRILNMLKDAKQVYRGNGQKGIMGECLLHACSSNSISKNRKEIASILGVAEKFLSKADRKIQELNENGIISIPNIIRPITECISQYLYTLKIDMKYTNFIRDCIERLDKRFIHIIYDSRQKSRIVGTIYLLLTRLKLHHIITKDILVKECCISKSTFNRYYKLLCDNYKIIKVVFKKHKIPMALSWKD